MKQTYSICTCTTCAWSLLHVCFMFASSCKRGITPLSGAMQGHICRRDSFSDLLVHTANLNCAKRQNLK